MKITGSNDFFPTFRTIDFFLYNLATGNSKKKPIDPQSLMDVFPLRVLADTLDDFKTVCPFCTTDIALHDSFNTSNQIQSK